MKKTKEKKPISKAKKVFNIVTSVLGGIILAIVLVAVIAVMVSKLKGEEPSLFGYRFMYILTDSMEPELKVGSSILVKNVNAKDVKVGDYVVYLTDEELYEKYKVKFITHECKQALHVDGDSGKEVINTQGIKQGAPLETVDASRVQAVFVSKVPAFFNKFFTFILTPYGLATLIAVPLVLALAMQLATQIKGVLSKEAVKSDDEMLQDEIEKQTAQITKEVQDYFLQEQEKIKEFLEKNKDK